jgi:hypothetical protein
MSEQNQNTQHKTYDIENNPYVKKINIHYTINPPETRVYLTANYIPKEKGIIIIGGVTKTADQYFEVTKYCLDTNKYIKYNTSILSFDFKISGHGTEVITKDKIDQLFLFGGLDESNSYSTSAYFIHPFNMNQTQIDFRRNKDLPKNMKDEYPLQRAYHTVNYDKAKNCIYIYGGTDLNISNSKKESFQAVWRLHLEECSWGKITLSNPDKRGAPRGHTSIFYKGKLYIFGGIVLFKRVTNNFYTINLEKQKIEPVLTKGPHPEPVAFHSAALVNDECFIMHGGLDSNFNCVNHCYLFYFNTEEFVKIEIPLIPKLFGHKLVVCDNSSVFIVGGMDNFKYVGDESAISQVEKEGEALFEKNEEELKYEPMKEMFEMVLKTSVQTQEIEKEK